MPGIGIGVNLAFVNLMRGGGIPGVLGADSGSFLFSGDTMTPLQDHKTPAGVGAFLFSGQTAGLIAARQTAAGNGGFTFAGQDATLTKSASLTTWNPSDKSTDVTLSNGNLTATTDQGFSLACTRSIASHSTGKYFASFTVNDVTGASALGIANGTKSLTGAPGGDLNSCGCLVENGNVSVNSGGIGTAAAMSNNDIIDMAVDLSAELIWFRVNGGNWNNSGAANPATGAGGFDFSGANAGPWYAICEGNFNRAWIANFGATSYTHAAPSGFLNW